MNARCLSLGLLLCLLAAACSPEDGRKRGERGADPGNRPDDGLLVRERTDVYRATPRKGAGRPGE